MNLIYKQWPQKVYPLPWHICIKIWHFRIKDTDIHASIHNFMAKAKLKFLIAKYMTCTKNIALKAVRIGKFDLIDIMSCV